MNQDEFKQFSETLDQLREILDPKAQPLTATVKAGYFKALSDLTFAEFEQAAERALNELEWFPRPKQLREMVQGSAQDQADAAWALLLDAIDKGAGQYHSCFVESGALAGAIVRCWGGFPQAFDALSGLTADAPMYASNRNAFRAAFASCRAEPQGRYFAGFTEIRNRGLNWLTDFHGTVVVIGKAVARLRMPFSGTTGELLPAAKEALMAMDRNALRAYLPAPAPALALPPTPAEIMPMPAEVKEFLAANPAARRLLEMAQSATPEINQQTAELPRKLKLVKQLGPMSEVA